MIFLDDMKDLKIYARDFWIPFDEDNKRYGSAIYLLTPNFESSKNIINLPYMRNNNLYQSYYMEKNMALYINQEGSYDLINSDTYIHGLTESRLDEMNKILDESKLTKKDREELPNRTYGLPDERRYPLPDESHVISAIRFFNKVEEDKEAELARNIIKRIKNFKMENEIHVGNANRFAKYWNNTKVISNEAESLLENLYDQLPYVLYECDSIDSWKTSLTAIKDCYYEDCDLIRSFIFDNASTITDFAYDAPNYKKYVTFLESLYDDLKVVTENTIYTNSVDVVIKNNKGMYLVQDHIRTGLITFPGGKVRQGESLKEAILREVMEEIGIELIDIKKLYDFNIEFKYNDSSINYSTNETTFEALTWTGSPANLEPNKCKNLKWVTEEELLVLPRKSQIIKKYITKLLSNESNQLNLKKFYLDNVIFYGYKYDVLSLRPYISENRLKIAYQYLGLKKDKYKLSVFIYNDDRAKDQYDNDSITIASKNLFEVTSKSNNQVTYEQYINSVLYMHCLYRSGYSNKSMAIYYAEYMARIKRLGGDTFYKAYKGIEKELGSEKLYNIVKDGDLESLFRYGTKYVKIPRNRLNESVDTLMNTDMSRNKYSFVNEGYSDNIVDDNFQLKDIEESHISDGKSIILFEAIKTGAANSKFRQLMYKDRIKKTSEIYTIYKRVKEECKDIKYTYPMLDKYKKRNLFIDLSFYNEVFFKNNMYQAKRGLDLYIELLNRLINDSQYSKAGYNKKTIFIPILDWDVNPETKMWLYKQDINPISFIYEMIRLNPMQLKNTFGDSDVVFCGRFNYFKINFSHEIKNTNLRLFLRLINRLRNSAIYNTKLEDEDPETPLNTSKSITMDIVDKIEKSQKVEINRMNFAGDVKDINDTKNKTISSEDDVMIKDNKHKEELDKEEKKKDELVQTINNYAKYSSDSEETLDKMKDDNYIKNMIADLNSDTSTGANINTARASRIIQLNNDLLNKNIKGKTVKQIIETDNDEKPLESTSLKVNSISDEWNNMTYMNFDKEYNQDKDILRILESLSTFSYPISVVNIDINDTSTSEDRVDTYNVQMEDFSGKRFTIKFDIPIVIDNKYMILRGNKKTINIQNFLMPIIKTDVDTCQIITNYNKIFIRRFGGTKGKSTIVIDRINKTFNKMTEKRTKNIKGAKIVYGINEKASNKYELPMDYIDFANIYDLIDTTHYTYYFNQDEIRRLADIDESKGLPFAIKKDTKEVIYFESNESYETFGVFFLDLLRSDIDGFSEAFEQTKKSTKYVYSKASIANEKIPLILICCLTDGLTKTLTKAGINYDIVSKVDNATKKDYNKDIIPFNDGYLIYHNTYSSSLLLNGLKESYTEEYSISNINSREMYIDFLDNYCSKIKLDSLDNFVDCLLDPITMDLLKEYNLPTDYVSILLYANNLLADNKYIRHTKMIGRRMRRNELIPAYFYNVITSSYNNYANQIRHSRNGAVLSIKKSAIIDAIMSDPTFSDKSILNALGDIEDTNAISTKGLSGMNADRSYSLDKRTFDDSMLNILGMSTGFAGNVGITRQATINMEVNSQKGFVNGNGDKMANFSDANTLTMTEAVTPFGSTRDDPFRTAMTFIQTSKHLVRTEQCDPMLVTNGADEAMPYLTTNIFAHKAKMSGKITELVPNDYLIVKYDDNTFDIINLQETIEKNSDGGFYVPLKLDTDLKVGSKVKPNDIIAYDKLSFSNSLGEEDNIAYNGGTLAKIAIMNTDEGFEDSAVVAESLTQKMATEIIMPKEIFLTKDTEVFNLVKVGDHIEEGDILLTIQNAYEDEDNNELLRALNADTDEQEFSDLGRTSVHSSVTGEVAGIQIYRTCDLEECSDTLKKIIGKYESDINKKKKVMNKYEIPSYSLPSTDKLEPIGKMKNKPDTVKIVIFQKFRDVLAVGDKIVYYSANKGVIKYIIPKGKEPYTDFRPNEEISSILSISSLNGRMVTSPIITGALSKLMIELDRSCKDLAGIPYDDSKI